MREIDPQTAVLAAAAGAIISVTCWALGCLIARSIKKTTVVNVPSPD